MFDYDLFMDECLKKDTISYKECVEEIPGYEDMPEAFKIEAAKGLAMKELAERA